MGRLKMKLKCNETLNKKDFPVPAINIITFKMTNQIIIDNSLSFLMILQVTAVWADIFTQNVGGSEGRGTCPCLLFVATLCWLSISTKTGASHYSLVSLRLPSDWCQQAHGG